MATHILFVFRAFSEKFQPCGWQHCFRTTAVLLGPGFVFIRSQADCRHAPSLSLARTQNSSLPHGYNFSSNALALQRATRFVFRPKYAVLLGFWKIFWFSSVNETRHWINGFLDLWIDEMRSGFARGPVRGALPKVCEGDPVHF